MPELANFLSAVPGKGVKRLPEVPQCKNKTGHAI